MKAKSTELDTLMLADGTTSGVIPKDGTSYKLQEVYKMLDCTMVQVVPSIMGRRTIVLCDEEGMLKGNPKLNVQASMAAGVPIVGHALVCDTKRFK